MQFKKEKLSIAFGISMIALSMFACSPVIAISWNEFVIIAIVVAVLLGPPLYRSIRKVEDFLKNKKKV